jgi:Ca2+-binding RTX toxin-like protein
MAIIEGTESNNFLVDTSGADTIYGYGGDDLLQISFGGFGDVIYGGAGYDTLSIDSLLSGAYSFSYQEIEAVEFQGRAGSSNDFGGGHNLTTNNTVDNLLGSNGNDFFDAGALDDVLYGGPNGNDTLYGGGGNDEVSGGPGKDYLNGGPGNDYVEGDDDISYLADATDGDFLDGGDGRDTLYGVFGNDVLLGASGNDSLNGGDGNDDLYGGAGNDTLVGGGGADIFHFYSPSSVGIDTIRDFKYLEGDKIEISVNGFGASSKDLFFYDYTNGALSFNGQRFATLKDIGDFTSISSPTSNIIFRS